MRDHSCNTGTDNISEGSERAVSDVEIVDQVPGWTKAQIDTLIADLRRAA